LKRVPFAVDVDDGLEFELELELEATNASSPTHDASSATLSTSSNTRFLACALTW
jgi:hypothetical protein